MARVAGETTQAAWVAKAKATGRRELEREVLAVRRRRLRGSSAQAGQLELGAAVAPAQLLADGHVAALDSTPAEDPPATITLRADGLQLARFEALVESARKRGLVPRAADRIVIHQCPDCGRAAAVTARGERTLAPAQVAAPDATRG